MNVLAIESHRAPYFGKGLELENMNHESVWATGGVVSAVLRATAGATPNTSRPAGLQVWNSSTMDRLTPAEYGDPNEPLRPISLSGARNGTFVGKVAVTSDGPIRDLRAAASDLTWTGGPGAITSAAVQVLYTIRDDRPLCRYRAPVGGFYDTLSDTAPAEVLPAQVPGAGPLGAMLPVWVKVRVPAAAQAGDYQGRLVISAQGAAPVEVSIRLRVADWVMPDPRDFSAHMALIQSADTLALQYQVPMWSEAHWRLVEQSFRLLGELGNKYVFLPMICRTNFGNEQSIVRWVKDGDGYRYDFSVFDRYLDLAQKYTKPDVVCLYVWERYTGEYHWAGVGERGGKPPLVTLVDPATGATQDLEGPLLGTPEALAFWEPVYREVRSRLEKRGLLGVTLMGMNGDAYRPTDAMGKMFATLMPGTKWIANSHADNRGGSIAGIPIGYNTAVYADLFPPPTMLPWTSARKVGWRLVNKADLFTRSAGPVTKRPLYHTQHLGVYRLTMESAFFSNYSGLGRAGFDFWPVLGRSSIREGVKHSMTVGARYPPCWDQLNIDRATENVVSPGPEGPIPTERFENLREGMQECEARVTIEKALIDPAARAKLGEERARRLEALLDGRAWLIRGAMIGGVGYEFVDSDAARDDLFAAAAEVARGLAG